MKTIINTKRILVICLSFFPFLLFAQSGEFIIKGKLGDLSAPAKVYLNYRSPEGATVKDSCVLVNGVFELKGFVSDPVSSAQFRLKRYKGDSDNGIAMWIEPGITFINGTDSVPLAKLTGSKLNLADQRLNTSLKSFNDSLYAMQRMVAAGNKVALQDFPVRVAKIKEEKIAAYRTFILSNPNSLVSLFALVDYGTMKYSNKRGIEDVEPLFNGLSTEVRNSKRGKEYKTKLENWKNVGIGSLAPDFTLFDENRKAVKLSEFKGKFVLVDFWASWCAPCRGESPNLTAQYKLYKNKNFTILGVSIDTEKDRDKWLTAIKEDHLTWPQVVGQVQDNEARLKFHVQSIPDNFLISPDGYILAKGLRGEELNKKLSELLAEKK